MSNKQYGNVGNPGDIYKHAALVQLEEVLTKKARPSSTLTYIDTHAFILEAPCKEPAAWLEEMGHQMLQDRAYEAYFRAEYPHVCSGAYRCSTGLILDRTKTIKRLNLVLAESDAPTRCILKAQLDKEFPTTETRTRTVLNCAEDLPQAPVAVKGALLALVDPFKIEDVDWDPIRQGLAAFIVMAADAVVEVFTYNSARDTVHWPLPPQGVSGPVATLNRKPYHLAVYCTKALRRQIARCCVYLGWQRVV